MADKVFVTVGVDGRNVPSGGESGQLLSKATDADYDFAWVSPGSGGGGTGGSPAETKSPKDTGTGRLGISEDYARQDHAHPINVPTTGLPVKDGTAAIGDSDYYAPFNHVHPLNVDATAPAAISSSASAGTSTSYARRDHVHTAAASNVSSTNGNVQTDLNTLSTNVTAATLNVISVSLPTASWVTDQSDSELHTQTVTVTNGTANTLVDLRPDKTVIRQMTEDGTQAIYVVNSSATFTAYALGEKPTVDLTIQATRVESVTPS